ncbi:MAG: acylphosphatase [Chloroflexi bacterium]|nr:acylphosphatase [Chloroflexota bacterium]
MPDRPSHALRAVVCGRVQGVGFRDYVETLARSLGLTGYVRNLPDGRSIEVVAEGSRHDLERLVDHLHGGPSSAHVTAVDTDWRTPSGAQTGFRTTY